MVNRKHPTMTRAHFITLKLSNGLRHLEMSLFPFYVPYDYMQEYTFEPFIKLLQGMHYYEKDAHTV